MGLRGHGYNDKGHYDSQGLAGWTMEGTEVTSPPSSESESSLIGAGKKSAEVASMTDVKWVKKVSSYRRNGFLGPKELVPEPDLVMPEDELGPLEHEIMKSWPNVEKGFAMIRPGTHPLRMNKSPTDPIEVATAAAGQILRARAVDAAGDAGGGNAQGQGQEAEGKEGEQVDVGLKKSPTLQTI